MPSLSERARTAAAKVERTKKMALYYLFSLLRFASTSKLSYAANDLLLVDSLPRGIIVPAKTTHIGSLSSSL